MHSSGFVKGARGDPAEGLPPAPLCSAGGAEEASPRLRPPSSQWPVTRHCPSSNWPGGWSSRSPETLSRSCAPHAPGRRGGADAGGGAPPRPRPEPSGSRRLPVDLSATPTCAPDCAIVHSAPRSSLWRASSVGRTVSVWSCFLHSQRLLLLGPACLAQRPPGRLLYVVK